MGRPIDPDPSSEGRMMNFMTRFHPRWAASFPAVPALALALVLHPVTAAAGTPACGIFVSALEGTDDGTCGLDPSDPCATITHGVARAVAEAQTCVFVQAAVYGEILTLSAAPLRIIGGYDADWNYAPWQQSGHAVTIVGGFDGATNQYLTVRLLSGADVELVNLRVQGVNASGSNGSFARSSYAIHAVQATLGLEGVRVIAGNGAPGTPGGSGTSASQTAAAAGQNGGPAAEYSTPCDNTSRGAGGSPGVGLNSTQNGGAGGPGGTMDTDCTVFQWDYTHRPGLPGGNAAVFQNGGYGYRGGGGAPCGPGGNGFAGSTVHGAGGAGASAGGALIANFWAPNSGGAGQLGAHGTGGGGGGGSGGCDTGTDSYGAGGGGGGAGGLRALSGGQGGHGGGSSFCVFAVQSALTFTDVDLQRASGGMGGAGGTGGAGQPGGSGGLGGAAVGDSEKGGDGGAGGRGGHSGGGGGGAGGSAYGVYACSSTYSASAVSFSGGAPGSGGIGGQPPFGGSLGGNSGSSGFAGAVYGAVLPACGAVAQGGAEVPVEARPARALAATAASGATCDPAPCLLVDVPSSGERFTLAFAGALPNPTSGRATFHFSLPEPAHATLRIFDAGGRLVRSLDAGTLGAGRHRFEWDGRNEAGGRTGAGVYFARFEALETEFTRRFTLVR